MQWNMGHLITLLARRSQMCVSGLLRPYNLTASELPFYMTLLQGDGLTQEQLTVRVCVDKAATARAVKSLEHKGLLTRRQDPADRRQNLVFLTQLARDLEDTVRGALLQFNLQLTQGIDPQALEQAQAVLENLEKNFSSFLYSSERGGKIHEEKESHRTHRGGKHHAGTKHGKA